METTSPTVWRRWLAREMLRLRRAAGLEQEDVAVRLRNSTAKVSYAENGRRPFRERDLREILLPLYGVPAEEWPIYLFACEQSRQRAWWDLYDEEVIPGWFRAYVGLEQGASSLQGFTMQLIPGLLQTPAYARAIMASEVAVIDPEDAASRTEVRLRRQEVLTREPTPLAVHFSLDEGVLRRVVGDHQVMAQQLRHLVALAERPNVTLQVLTFERGFYFDGKGEPVLLRFPWDDDRGVVYVESRTMAELLEKPAEVTDYSQAFDHLQRLALPPVESVAMIEQLAKDHEQ
jgi:hypothetical protein